MTRHERLVENYEDACFALLMEEVAQREGERLEARNLELLADPAAAVPEDIDQRCLRTIDRCFAEQRRQLSHKTAKRILKYVAVIATTTVLLLSTALAVFPPFRAYTLNLMIEVLGDRTNMILNDLTSADGSADSDGFAYEATARWLPDGFQVDTFKSSSQGSWTTYVDSKNREIQISVRDGEDTVFSVDTEHATVQNIEVQGFDAMLIEKDNIIQIAWADTEMKVFVDIVGTDVEKPNLIRVAEKTIIK